MSENKKFWRVIYSLTLVLTDIFAYYAALIIAYELRIFTEILLPVVNLQFTLPYFLSLWWILAITLFFQLINGLYYRRDPLWIESWRVLRALLLSFVVTFAVVSLGRMSGDVSRLFLCLLYGLMPFVFVVTRLFVKRVMFRISPFQERVLIAGAGDRLEGIARSFESEKFMGIKIAAVCHIDKTTTKAGLDKILADNSVDAAILVHAAADAHNITPLFSHIHTKVRKMMYIPEHGAMDMTNAETGQLLRSQLGYLSLNNALQSSFNRLIKRFMDIIIAIILMPLFLPVLIVLIAAVRLTSPGPGIFSHGRIGRDGKTFMVYKLRSMYKDAGKRLEKMITDDPAIKAEWEANYKLKDDPRITPLGSFLRKSSLDELPQFFNVLKGEMSFVGPRPVLREELDKYYKEKEVYYNMAMPGITGLWQVSGRNDTTYADRVDIDCWYVFNWSLWLDVVILFSTPFAVIFRKGAY
ncbi:MAG: sugar transferase [Deferribacteraceae bacterium]|jgi:undecaprenyl-phosphate galactose phosphotransferase|nr:sugar transferase [Deferribacteraceae bacterium]